MRTIILKINEKSKAGKALKNLIDALAGKQIGVEVIEDKDAYNPEFVKKIINSDKKDKRIRINTDNIWESI